MKLERDDTGRVTGILTTREDEEVILNKKWLRAASITEEAKKRMAAEFKSDPKWQGKSFAFGYAPGTNSWLLSTELPEHIHRFAAKARLDVLPTNFNLKMWKARPSATCACGHERETMGHLLSHCERFKSQRRALHNRILERIEKTVCYNNSTAEIQIDKLVNESKSQAARYCSSRSREYGWQHPRSQADGPIRHGYLRELAPTK